MRTHIAHARIYPKSPENRAIAIEIIKFLDKPQKQKDVEKEFFEDFADYSSKACSRMLNKLKNSGYVKYFRVGKEKLWKRIK